ncbi:hypothetical protein D3C72_2340430 [compost metagenome]
MQVLHQADEHLLEAGVGRAGKAGDDRLGDVVLVEVAHGCCLRLAVFVGSGCGLYDFHKRT